MKVDFGCGVEMEPSTQEDIDYVEANFREGDRLEHESLDGGRTLLKVFEDCWTVRVKGMIVGYCGVAVPADMTPFGNERYLCYMSCENANKVKLTYVRKSRDVMRGIIERTDPSIEILWENCGGFPFWEGNEKPATAFVDKILDSKRPVGLAWKAQLRQDWSCWAHQAGPYLLGCAGADVTRRDVALAEELQGLYTEDWYESGREAHALLRHIRGGAHPPAELNSVTEYNPPFAFSTLAEAELFWSAAEDWEKVARRVRFRARSRW